MTIDHSAATQPIRYAGFWIRFIALLIDTVIVALPFIAIWIIFKPFPQPTTGTPPITIGTPPITIGTSEFGDLATFGEFFGSIRIWALVQLAAIGVYWLYEALQVSSSARATLGKRAMGLVVVSSITGQRLSFANATGRHFAKYVSSWILNIGFLMAAFTKRKQGLHDLIADTVVIRR